MIEDLYGVHKKKSFSSLWSFKFSNKIISKLVISGQHSNVAYQIEELDERIQSHRSQPNWSPSALALTSKTFCPNSKLTDEVQWNWAKVNCAKSSQTEINYVKMSQVNQAELIY